MNELSPWQPTATVTHGWTWIDAAGWHSAIDHDEPPMDGGEGVREPRRPRPAAPSTAASLTGHVIHADA